MPIPHPFVRIINGTRVVVEPVAPRSYSLWVAGKAAYSVSPVGKLWFVRGYDGNGGEHIIGIKDNTSDALQLAVANYHRSGVKD